VLKSGKFFKGVLFSFLPAGWYFISFMPEAEFVNSTYISYPFIFVVIDFCPKIWFLISSRNRYFICGRRACILSFFLKNVTSDALIFYLFCFV